MADIPKPLCYKTIAQARHTELPYLIFELPKLVQSLKKEDEKVRMQKGVTSLVNTKDHFSVQAHYRATTYQQDSHNLQMEEENIARFFHLLPPRDAVQKCTRFGFARRYVTSVEEWDIEFEILVQALDAKLYSQNPALRKILPQSVDDMAYRVNFKEGDYKIDVTIGSVKKDELSDRIGLDVEGHFPAYDPAQNYESDLTAFPKVGIFYDIDFSQSADDLDTDSIFGFCKIAGERVHKLVRETNTFLLKELI